MIRFRSLIIANLLRNRRRTLLTASSIAVSLSLLTVLLGMYSALFLHAESGPSQALRLITHHRISITQPMPVSFESKIRGIPGVQDVMLWQWFGGTYKDARDPKNFFARFAVEPDRFFHIKPEVQLPDEQKLAFQRARTGCIVGRKLADRFQWKLGDRISLVGDIFPVDPELTIAGIYNDLENEETLYFNYEYLSELKKGSALPNADTVGTFVVQAASPEDVEAVAAAIDKEFENSSAPTKTETERAWQLNFVSFLGNLKLFLLSISGALTFTVLLVAGNTVSMSVRDRIREVGILKTLGLSRQTILSIFLGESLLLSLAGSLAGLVLGAALCFGVQNSGTIFAALRLSLTPWLATVIILFGAAVGLLSSAIPAYRASRSPILVSLKDIG